MGTDESIADRHRTAILVWIDAIGYAVAVTTIAIVAALAVGIASGGGFVRAKALLFLAGFALMGYATIRLWPTSPEDAEAETDAVGRSIRSPRDRTRFQSFVRALPPLRWLPPPPAESRISPASKLFVGSLLVLFASYVMETVFGIV